LINTKEKEMGVLAQLKLTTAAARTNLTPVQMRRNKLIARLDEQIELATAQIEGRKFSATRTRIVKDKETGESRSVESSKRVKQFWFTDDKGRVIVQIKYGTKTLMLGKNVNSVEVASKDGLVATLVLLKQAVEAGELDAQIEAAAEKSK
jgi:hypothetical protein